MFFVYLRDGRTLEIPEAESVAHRTRVAFLNKQGLVIEELPTEEIAAYSHLAHDPAEDLAARPRHVAPPPSDLEALGRRRHPRSSPGR